MTKVVLVCRACGVRWISVPAVQLIRQSGQCLRCDSDLIEEHIEVEDDLENSDETPNGLPE